MAISAEATRKILALARRYRLPRGALLGALWIVMEDNGYVAEEDMRAIASLLGVTKEEVYGAATYYDMFRMEPVGRYLVRFCTNLSCRQAGGEDLLAAASQALGIGVGQTTMDGAITLAAGECIGACHRAPAIMVNDELLGPIDREGLRDLLARLRGARP